MTKVPNLGRLRDFVSAFATLMKQGHDEPALLEGGTILLSELVAHDDWLPDIFAQPSPERYQQYLLHCDSSERFSVVSFVWGAGQSTPIHDHRIWGLVGLLRGAELIESFRRDSEGALRSTGAPGILSAGQVDGISPATGDIHRVANAYDDRTSISIHVYGTNIGAIERATYDLAGQPKRFISGYANRILPNLWDRSTL